MYQDIPDLDKLGLRLGGQPIQVDCKMHAKRGTDLSSTGKFSETDGIVKTFVSRAAERRPPQLWLPLFPRSSSDQEPIFLHPHHLSVFVCRDNRFDIICIFV